MLPPFDIVVSAGYIHANLVPLAFLLIFFYGFYELVVRYNIWRKHGFTATKLRVVNIPRRKKLVIDPEILSIFIGSHRGRTKKVWENT